MALNRTRPAADDYVRSTSAQPSASDVQRFEDADSLMSPILVAMDAIANEKYVSLTTYKKDGSPVSVPVWIADLEDGTVGFTTASSSWKVKRIGNNPKVTLQPSDSRGNPLPKTEAVSGTAEIRRDQAGFEAVKRRIKAKYGFQYTLTSLIGLGAKLIGRGSGTDTGIVVTID